ncbi:MAG: amidohydrolase [Lysobacteraceae bacterium]|nr:MAG: amidohydrolase [Xanthomonadaceae bacterium]
MHVHLHDAANSARAFEADAASAKLELAGYAGMWFGGPNQAAQGDPAAIRAANDAQLALAKEHPKMLPVATVHPYDGEAALAEVARVAGLGCKVLKLHPHTQQFDAADPRVLAIAKRAGELGLVVMFDNANILPGDSEKLFNLAVQAPKTKFLFAHIGAMNFRFWNVLPMARTADAFFADNIHFDLSGTITVVADSPLEPEFVWTLRNVGIDRVLLGSDYPQFSLASSVEALDRLDLTEAEKAKIRVGNARRLFGLAP